MGKAQIIDGTAISRKIKDQLKVNIEEWVEKGYRQPHLVGIIVGHSPSSEVYVRSYTKAGESIGLKTSTVCLDENTPEEELLERIKGFNKDDEVDGILILLPLPNHISNTHVWNTIDPRKDVEGLNKENLGKLYQNIDTYIPCTALGIIELIRSTGIEVASKNVVICGRSKNVGLAVATILHSDQNNPLPGYRATVTICHKDTPQKELEEHLKKADVIVATMGIPNFIRREFVKSGACIIDANFNKIIDEKGNEKFVGDVDFEGVSEVAGFISPVPGGMGPMIVAMLMENTFKAAKINAEKN